MNENKTWIIVIGCVALGGMGFASLAKDMQVAMIIGGFASSICVSLLTLLKTSQTAAKTDLTAAKVDATSAKVDVTAAKADVAAKKAEQTANLVQENAVHTDDRLEFLAKTTETIQTQGNHARGELLETILQGAVTIAEIRNAPGDHEAVQNAQRRLDEHKRGQATVDAAAGKPSASSSGTDVPEAHMDVVADAQKTARDAQTTAKGAQAVAKNLTEGAK